MLVYLMFTVSGATALIYQVIWSRWLGLVLGNTTISVSLILAAFMLGLALGSLIAGRTLDRVASPLRAYAWLELGIGIFALSFPFVTELADLVFPAIITPESPEGFSILVRGVFALLILLLPTTLMGATLPFLTDFFRRSPRHSRSWKVGVLYAANTIGAALGIVLAGFLLIELIGIANTGRLAAGFNILIAFIAFAVAANHRLSGQQPTAVARDVDAEGTLAISVLTVSGATALASEVLWTRTMESLVGNSTYAFSTIVLLYLVGIAMGSWLMSLIVNRIRNHSYWLAALQAGMGIWIFIAIFLFQDIAVALDPYKGNIVPITLLLWIYFRVMVVLFPLALLSGACFPLATRIIDPESEDADGRLIARAYSWNTIGAVAGSLMAGFLIAPFFDYLNSLYLLSFIYTLTATCACAFLFRRKLLHGRQMTAAALITIPMAITALIAMYRTNTFIEHVAMINPSLEVVSHKQGLQGITTIIRKRDEPYANQLLVNGLGMTIKVTDTKMMAHLPMLLHEDPQDTLIICFGMGTTFRSAISHGKNVTAVELVAEVLNGFDRFHSDAPAVRAYKNGHMVVNDGRNFLKLTRKKYDVITIDPPPPIDAAGVNHLHSREFLLLARSHLKKRGIMAHWIPFPGTNGGVDDVHTFNMLLATFAEVFPYVYTQTGFTGVGLHVLGSMEPLEITTANLEKRLSSQKVLNDILEWDQVPIEYFEGIKGYQPATQRTEIISDDRPWLEFYLLKTWRQGAGKSLPFTFW